MDNIKMKVYTPDIPDANTTAPGRNTLYVACSWQREGPNSVDPSFFPRGSSVRRMKYRHVHLALSSTALDELQITPLVCRRGN